MGDDELAILVLAAASVRLLGSDLASKDDGFKFVSQGLPDGEYINNPSLPTLSKLPDPTWVGYARPARAPTGIPSARSGFVFYPIGVALDWVIMKPLYMLGGLAPEWFGLNTDDAHRRTRAHAVSRLQLEGRSRATASSSGPLARRPRRYVRDEAPPRRAALS